MAPLPFEFVVAGPPVSQQARRRARYHTWVEEVRQAAAEGWPPSVLPVEAPVQLSITHFYEGAPLDVDNLPKPIADALKGLVYLDDAQVNDLLCRRRSLSGPLRLVSPTPTLAAAVAEGNEFLYVVVDSAPDQEVVT